MKEYLYDPHTHTAETSKCGHLPAAEVVDRYAGHGFSGLVVTDHLHPEYLSRIDTDHNWDHVIDHYLAGYRASKARGDELGLDVILGAGRLMLFSFLFFYSSMVEMLFSNLCTQQLATSTGA